MFRCPARIKGALVSCHRPRYVIRMVVTVALLFAVFFWTLARCARILGNLARELQGIQNRERERLAKLVAEIETEPLDESPRRLRTLPSHGHRRTADAHESPLTLFGNN